MHSPLRVCRARHRHPCARSEPSLRLVAAVMDVAQADDPENYEQRAREVFGTRSLAAPTSPAGTWIRICSISFCLPKLPPNAATSRLRRRPISKWPRPAAIRASHAAPRSSRCMGATTTWRWKPARIWLRRREEFRPRTADRRRPAGQCQQPAGGQAPAAGHAGRRRRQRRPGPAAAARTAGQAQRQECSAGPGEGTDQAVQGASGGALRRRAGGAMPPASTTPR